MSAARAIRDGLACSEAAANNILRSLKKRRLVEPADHGKGWQISADARRMVV